MASALRSCLGVLSFLLIHQAVHGQIPDNRCFLESGGSAESFFVSEDQPVGAVIGFLRIYGDPSDRGGNIVLRLKELDSPVRIVPGTKNLTLTRRLDKEGVDGPSSVYVNVICDRKRTADPGFVIPVNIRVTDANDNAPEFINAPYVLNISEVTVVGTRVLQGVRAVDADQQGPYSTVQYSVLPGQHADYFVFVNGLEGTLLLRKPLDYETLSNFSVAIRAQDQGSPPQYSDTVLYVNVIDADDQNPRFYDDRYTAILPDNPTQGTRLLIQPRDIAAYDQDLGINAALFYTFNSGGADYRYFDIDRDSGHVTIKRSIPDDDLIQPATLVVRATQYDNQDRYALATLTVSRAGTAPRELQFLQKNYLAGVLENAPVNSILLAVVTNKPRDQRLRFWLEDTAHPGGVFSVSSAGDIILRQPLDYETVDFYSFLVHVTDGRTNDTARVNISVLNVNDWEPRFRYPQYEFFISNPEVSPGDIVGRVEAADGDRGDSVTLSLRGPGARMFDISDTGDIILVDMTLLNGSTVHMVAVATDSGIPPRQTTVPVIVHFPESVVQTAGGTSFLLMVVFGSLLAILGLIIIMLILYIYKHKKQKSGNSPGTKGYMNNPIQHEKLSPRGEDKVENPMFHSQQEGGPFQTATVKSIMARNTSSRGSVRGSCTNPFAPGLGSAKHKVAPAPPQLPDDARASTPTVDNNNQPKNGVTWPSGSIPRRVKKLSWDDESCQQRKLEMDPEVSVTPLTAQEQQPSDQMNLTVYF